MKTKVTETTFKAVKTLIQGGASTKECAEYMKLGYSTICRINSAENWEEYKQILAAMGAKIKSIKGKAETEPEQKPEPKPEPKPVNVSSSYQMNRIIDLLKAQNETLVLLSNKLAFIVDELV